ncbi:MAG TPA: PQQ-binding-like beta-propeller repeat protein [Gemmataceae bacterium]|jgi:outer membrane protein assembly factor BamB|nr:PQQ-binding-like beta-propeller repeat protein [Gemmataceae bacterium]
MATFIASLLLLLALAADDANSNWPDFRGGARGGVVDDKRLPESWSTTKNVLWKTDIPGKAWSSPIVWNSSVFLTSVVREGKGEAPKKGLYFGGERSKPPEDVHRWMVYCLDWGTGKIRWEREAHHGAPDRGSHLKNSYASETPVTDGERVYAFFGNLGVFCYDMNGEPLWSRRIESYPTFMSWGTASSPVLYKGRLYVLDDNEKTSFLTALDAKTGKEIWRVERDERTSWATPFIWENDLRTELITCGKKRIRSYDLDGKLLWELGGMSSLVIPTPLAKFGMLYLSSGYVNDKAQPIFVVKPGASGDITLPDDKTSNEFIVWSVKKGGPYNPSPILYGDNLYVLYDFGFMSCYDARTGKEIYKRNRIGGGGNAFTSSPWAANGKIYCLSEDGDTFVIQAGPDFKILGKNSLEEMCLATPAISRGCLIIRTMGKVYKIGKSNAAE